MSTLTIIAITLLCSIGLFGTLLPAMPGSPLIFLAVLVAYFNDSSARIGSGTIIVTGVLMLISFVVDFAATAMGAKRMGASRLAIFGAALGTLVGIFFLLPGLIFGPFIGALIGEFICTGNFCKAGQVGVATWIGLLVGTAARFGIGLAMVMIIIFKLF